ncbi:hypothetical protein ACTU44_10050 [Thalassospira sp. SM2505]
MRRHVMRFLGVSRSGDQNTLDTVIPELTEFARKMPLQGAYVNRFCRKTVPVTRILANRCANSAWLVTRLLICLQLSYSVFIALPVFKQFTDFLFNRAKMLLIGILDAKSAIIMTSSPGLMSPLVIRHSSVRSVVLGKTANNRVVINVAVATGK